MQKEIVDLEELIMTKRVVSAIIALLIFMPLIIKGGWIFNLVAYIIALIGLKEFIDAKSKKKPVPFIMGLLAYIFLSLIILVDVNSSSTLFSLDFRVIAALFIAFLLPVVLYNDQNKYSITDAFYMLGGVLFLGMSMALLIMLRHIDLKVFVSGFFGNAILSMLLTYLGQKLNVDIYLAAIVVFVGKKDNVMLHFIAYLAFFGGVITMIYPDFLDSQSFWDIRSITGLLHHSLMVYGVVALVMCDWMRPTLKRWYVYPLGYACLMTVGLFEETALGFTKSIYAPLIGSMEILTSWYMMYGVTTLLAVLTMYIFDKKSLCKSNC